MTEKQNAHKFIRTACERTADFRMRTYHPHDEDEEVNVIEYTGVDGVMIIVEDEHTTVRGATTLDDQIRAAESLVASTAARIGEQAPELFIGILRAAELISALQQQVGIGLADGLRKGLKGKGNEDEETE